jgi:hypothetical protein
MLHFQQRRKFIKIPSGLKTLKKNEVEAEVFSTSTLSDWLN